MLLTAREASSLVGVSEPTFKALASDPANNVNVVSHKGSRTKWFRRSEVERLCIGDQIGDTT